MKLTHLFLAGLACFWNSACDSVAPTGSEINSSQGTASGSNRSEQDSNWQLDSDSSRVAFASIKAGEIVETHYFPGISGTIAINGEVAITIPLDRVETGIDLRNQRMRELFFETDEYPISTIRATIDQSAFHALSIGSRIEVETDVYLSLHGVEQPVQADTFVTRISSSRVEIASMQPVIIYANEFDLQNGLEALRNVAGLPSIAPSVPVTFSFVFEKVSE